MPKHAGLEFGCVYAPTLRVSGDFYDFLNLHGGYLGVCVADVVGKGIPAALRMASVRSSLRAFANVGYDLHTVMELVNRQLCRETQTREFVTLAYGVFSPDGRLYNHCNAGHIPPLLLREDKLTQLTAGGLVLGVRPRETYDEEPVVIRPGDIIVLVTDGVTEALNFSHEPYGNERLHDSIRRHQSLDAQSLAQQLLWDVRRFVGLAEQSDDITIVAVRAV
jgi:sigma-B regulation protein RsbU (phosphoserine phosphatase)